MDCRPEMRPQPDQPPPMLYGPDNLTEGYYELEKSERNTTLEALRQHKEPAALWYRALTLYWRGMLGTWDFSDVDEDMSRLRVYGLQSQLLGLGITSAKGALDMLLAGYYSIAFASIRHMLETYIQYLFVAVEPEAASRWYRQSDDVDTQARTPGCRQMVDTIKARFDLVPPAFVDEVYEAWALMSKGSHPTGEGIVQTVGDDEGEFFVVGAIYNREFCLTGFDHGLFAVVNLLTNLVGLRPQSNDWKGDLGVLQGDISEWRKSAAADEQVVSGVAQSSGVSES